MEFQYAEPSIYFILMMIMIIIASIMNCLFRYNISGSGSISLSELKQMMERLGAPQTHLGLKAMMKEIDEDGDGAIAFR